jgi:dihydrofolate reductase
MNDMRKLVVSTKPEELAWSNAEQLLVTDEDDLVAQIQALKSEAGEYLLLYGGVRTAQTFVRHGLVDEYRLDLCPAALGSGKALFPSPARLTLVETTPYESGAMSVVYRPA